MMRLAAEGDVRGARIFLFQGRDLAERWQQFIATALPALENAGWQIEIAAEFGTRRVGTLVCWARQPSVTAAAPARCTRPPQSCVTSLSITSRLSSCAHRPRLCLREKLTTMAVMTAAPVRRSPMTAGSSAALARYGFERARLLSRRSLGRI